MYACMSGGLFKFVSRFRRDMFGSFSRPRRLRFRIEPPEMFLPYYVGLATSYPLVCTSNCTRWHADLSNTAALLPCNPWTLLYYVIGSIHSAYKYNLLSPYISPDYHTPVSHGRSHPSPATQQLAAHNALPPTAGNSYRLGPTIQSSIPAGPDSTTIITTITPASDLGSRTYLHSTPYALRCIGFEHLSVSAANTRCSALPCPALYSYSSRERVAPLIRPQGAYMRGGCHNNTNSLSSRGSLLSHAMTHACVRMCRKSNSSILNRLC